VIRQCYDEKKTLSTLAMVLSRVVGASTRETVATQIQRIPKTVLIVWLISPMINGVRLSKSAWATE
jgi:hypothetical protein